MEVKCPKCGRVGRFGFFCQADHTGIISMITHVLGWEAIDTPFGRVKREVTENCFFNIEETQKIVPIKQVAEGIWEIQQEDKKRIGD